jgi:hypothetical protein
VPFPYRRCRFRRSFPGRFPSPAFLDRVSFRRPGGLTSPIYFFFFFAAFLAFLFFAITSLHKKLKKQSTAPVQLQRAIQPPGRARRRILFVARCGRATRKIYFLAKKLVLFAKFETLPEKIFSSIAQFEESSKNYFVAKRRQTSSKRRVRDALDRDHRWKSTWI